MEDRAARTNTAKTFRNPDGTHTTKLSPTPVHYWDGSEWEDIDDSIVSDVERPGLKRNRANSFVTRFGPVRDGVSISAPEATFTMTPEGVLAADEPVVEADGETVVYAEVWPGIDLRYCVDGDHVKEDIVLKRPTDMSTFRFTMSGATVTPRPDGGLDFGGALTGRWWFLPPVVLDRDGQPI